MIIKLFETQNQLLAAQVQAASLQPLANINSESEGERMEFE